MKDQILYTPAEAARLFRVEPKTVSRWAHQGRFNSITLPDGRTPVRRTIGGHLRLDKPMIDDIVAGRLVLPRPIHEPPPSRIVGRVTRAR